MVSDGPTSGQDATPREYEVVVVGGGPAGLTATLYATRLGHETAVVDRGGGRAAMMRDTHNVVGVPERVSGNEFLGTAVEQVTDHGADLHRELVTAVEPVDGDGPPYRVEAGDLTMVADRLVLATGFTDRRPEPPLPRTGRGLHYCLHCDAATFVDRPVYVMGHGESAAQVAMILLNFTDDVDFLLRGEEPTWSEATDRQLRAHPVDVVEADVTGVENGEDGWLEAMTFADGSRRPYRGGFAMYGADYSTDLAESLGCELAPAGTIDVDDHGRTSVDGVYAVGDVTPGHNQIPVAMGQGAKAGIDVHADLRRFPKSLDELAAQGAVDSDGAPAVPPAEPRQADSSGADD